MRTAKVTLGGTTFEIHERPTRKNEAWREELSQRLAPLMELIDVADVKVEMASMADLKDPAKRLIALLSSSPAEVRALLVAYDPKTLDEEWILDNAYDSEIVAAFVQVLGLAYPFGSIVTALSRLSAPS